MHFSGTKAKETDLLERDQRLSDQVSVSVQQKACLDGCPRSLPNILHLSATVVSAPFTLQTEHTSEENVIR